MIEIQNTGSLFYLSQNEHEAVVVTTNGVIRKNGDAVLGKGQGLEAKKLADGTEKAEGEFILFTYTDGRGIVPPVVEQFLKENHSLLKGIVVSGNMQRHGDTFCAAGEIIAKEYQVPVIAQVDGAGNEWDYRQIRSRLQESEA